MRAMRAMRLLALVFSAALALAACGSSGSSGSPYGAITPTTKSGSVSSRGETVSIASNAALGKYLVGPNGHTLYLFEKDQGTTTACTGGCVPTWPPLTADNAPTGVAGIDAASLSRADGVAANQVTYHGHLLYFFAGDQSVGDSNGSSVPFWHPVGPDGNKIDQG